MTNRKFAAESVIGGILVTIITRFYNGTPSGLVGATWYGFPVTWIRRLIIAPQYNPWRIDFTGLVVDLAIWIVVSGFVIFITKRTQKTKKRRRRS